MGIKKSDEITNTEASPQVFNNVAVSGGRIRVATGAIALETGDLDNDDEIRLAKLPSNAVIHKIGFKNDDLDSDVTPTLTANVGVFEAGGTGIKDEDAFATAITTFQSANTTWQYIENEAKDINEVGQALWEDGALSADPGGLLEVGIKLSAAAATAAAGDLSYLIEYTVD